MPRHVRVYLRAALVGGASLASLGWASAAAAQDTRPVTSQDVGSEIVVTGSRVRGQAPVGSSVTSLGRTEIESSAAVTVDRLIKEIPQNFDLGVSENSRAQSGGSGNITFGNSVNLRGIGPYATLVLVDGHRVVNNSRSTDPSILPTLGVERVEVVADGASAIYGSDAVAGVVNLVPRRTLNGVEAFARVGVDQGGDFHEYSGGVALGKVFDRGQAMLAYEHVERSALPGSTRDFFVSDQRPFGGNDYRTTRCAPGTIRAGGTTYAIPATGVTPATAGTLTPGTANRCDELTGQDLFPDQSYNSLNGTATFELTNWLSVFGDGFYSRREFFRRNPFGNTSITVPSTNAFFVRPAGFAGSSYTIDYNFRNDLPQDNSSGYARSWQVTPGLRAKLPHGWELEGLIGIGRTSDFSGSYVGINNAALNAALASSDPATAFDPYGLGRTSQAVINGIANQIFLAPTKGKLTTYDARANGGLFALPGGEVKLAIGYERQDFDVSLGSARGGPTTPITFRNFGRTVDSGYAELFVPIFGSGNATTGLEKLELNAAVRRDKYSDVGTTTNPKFGVNWSPVRGLIVRGSYGTSFRAPTIPEIYGNSNNLFVQNYQNPLGGPTIQGLALSGQNLDLQPETATTWSAGADIDLIDNLRLGVTYWDVKYESQVLANLSNLAILNQETQYAGTGIIRRGTAAAAAVQDLVASGIQILGAPAQPIQLLIDGRSQNLGVSITRGIDFTADYRLPIGEDTLRFNASGTYLTDYRVAVTPTAPLLDQRNLIFRPLKFKARASVTWDHGPLTARAQAVHVGGYTNNVIVPNQQVASYTPVDLTLSWRVASAASNPFGGELAISFEVRNVLDEDPPYVNIAPSGNGSGGYDATAASPVGRLFAVSVRAKF